jgi:hypothetical protein
VTVGPTAPGTPGTDVAADGIGGRTPTVVPAVSARGGRAARRCARPNHGGRRQAAADHLRHRLRDREKARLDAVSPPQFLWRRPDGKPVRWSSLDRGGRVNFAQPISWRPLSRLEC